MKKISYKRSCFVLFLFLMANITWVSAQAVRVTGSVKDTTGVLPGVTVQIKDTNSGTQTDENGNYVLDVSGPSAILVYTMVGYVGQEIQVNQLTEINVVLEADPSALDEVVVVGFGQQKRSDMVGSVTSVSANDLKKNPSSNLTTALAGRVAGMIAYQRSGEPGQDNADFFIRGVTTFGYKVDPLILIDNMEVTTTQDRKSTRLNSSH